MARRLVLLGSVLLVGVLVGCGGPPRPASVVKGKVTYKGTAIPSGTVTFHDETNAIAGQGSINEGEYRVEGAQPGPVKVTVKTPPPSPPPPPGTPLAGPQVNSIPIPDAYGSPQTSGLQYTVKDGEQVHDIELK